MALESATYINGLVAANPTATDPKSQGDDHIRLLKSTIQATFPSITGAVTATQTELNQIGAKAPIESPALTGTPTAPTATPGAGNRTIATTAYVDSAVLGATINGIRTPDFVLMNMGVC